MPQGFAHLSKTLAIGLALAWSSASQAAAARDAGLPGEFLNYGVGARPLGMGRAFTAVADDIDSIYWNPAGLSSYRSNQVTFQHSPLTLGGAYQYFAYSQPLFALGHVGVGVVNLQSDEVPRVDASNVEIGTFKNRETGYLLSYANHVGERLGLGASFKAAEHAIDGRRELGIGADVGSLYRVTENVQMGAMVRNAVRPSYGFSSERETFPTIVRVGSAVKMFKNHVTAALDVDKTIGISQSPRWHFGLEGYAIENIVLRLGVDQTEFTGGIGLRWKTFQLDYAAGLQDLGFLNRASIKAFFGGYEVDIKASPSVFSPVGLKDKTTFRISTSHRERIVKWVLSIRNAKGEVVKSFQGFNAPPATLEWNGRDANDQIVEAGEYSYRMTVTDKKNKTETTPRRTLRVGAPTPFEIEAR
jgi:opacity protein-like surface antigen